jgi:hypothetical protein
VDFLLQNDYYAKHNNVVVPIQEHSKKIAKRKKKLRTTVKEAPSLWIDIFLQEKSIKVKKE